MGRDSGPSGRASSGARPDRSHRGAAGSIRVPRQRPLRPADDGTDLDRLRRRLRSVLAADLRASRDRRGSLQHDRAPRSSVPRAPRPSTSTSSSAPRRLAGEAVRARSRPGAGGQDLRRRGRLDWLSDARDRGERALRRRPRHTLECDEHAVPRRRPRLPDPPGPARRAPVPPDLEAAVHRRGRRRLVGAGVEGREHRPGGVLQRPAAREAGPDPCVAPPAGRLPEGDHEPHRPRDPVLPRRHRARLPGCARRRWA